MDNRVGTGSTLARAYSFLFGHVADVIGLGWLAAVFYGASVFFLIQRLTDALLIAPPSTPLVNQFTLLYFAGFLIATAFFGAAMSVAMTRNALGNLDSRAGVYFVFGLKEARAFWAFVKLYVIAAALTLATGLLSLNGALIAALQISPPQLWLGMPPTAWLIGAAGFVTICVFVFIEARLGFFLAPLAASGERPLLRASWQLSRGNVWATFASSFVVLFSVFGLLAACYYFFSDSSFNATMIAQRGDPAMWHAISSSAAAIAAICAITLTIVSGLFAGASASAYAAVESNLERAEETSLLEPVHTMVATPRVESGFFAQTDGTAFAAAPAPEPAHIETPAQPVNVIGEPVAVVPAEAPVEVPSEKNIEPAEEQIEPVPAPVEYTPEEGQIEDLRAEDETDASAAEITPPPASSEVPPVSPEPAPLEAV